MIPRYSLPEMAELWSDTTRLGRWLEIELLATEAQVDLGVVPAADSAARVWNRAFWRKPEDAEYPDPVLQTPGNVGVLPRTMVGSTAGLVVFGVALTVFAGPLFHLADGSAEIMLDRTAYIHSVLGDSAQVPPVGQSGAAK